MLRIINSIMKTTVESIINRLDQTEARILAGEDEVKGDIQSRSSGWVGWGGNRWMDG